MVADQPEVTALSPREEAAFQAWAKTNGIADVDAPDAHYDYRGFWKETSGAPHPPGSQLHFPDTYKQHGHPTFSVESKYSTGANDGGRWNGDTYVSPTVTDQTDPIADALRAVPISDRVRATAWDAFYQAKDADDLAARLKELPLPDDVKAGLWDAKEKSASTAGAMNFAIVNGQRVPVNDTGSTGDVILDNVRDGAGLLKDVGIGALKGAGSTVANLGGMMSHMPGVHQASDAVQRAVYGDVLPSGPLFEAARTATEPTNTAQSVGKFGEQAAEYFIPGTKAEKFATTIERVLPQITSPAVRNAFARILSESAISGGTAVAQGTNPVSGVALGAAVPSVQAVRGILANALQHQAEPLVRAAVKPTVASLKRIAGASQTGIEAQARRLSQFILEHRLTTADKAQAIVDGAERELQHVIDAHGNPLTDAPQRVMRYLRALRASASRQGLPAEDVGVIDAAARRFIKTSPLAEDVTTTVMQNSPSGIVTSSGKPVQVPTPQTTRALRKGVPAREALETARGTSRWQTRKAYGEQKGAATEVQKAVERGSRDAVKTAVPDTKPIFSRQSKGIQAREALDRMAIRTGNRDAVSLPAHVVAAGELATGRLPILAFAANWLRNNQLKAGIYADSLATAIRQKNAQQTAKILSRLGVEWNQQTTEARP